MVKSSGNEDPQRKIRNLLSVSHNQRNSDEARLAAASKYCELHEAETGERLDPATVMKDKPVKRKGSSGGKRKKSTA